MEWRRTLSEGDAPGAARGWEDATRRPWTGVLAGLSLGIVLDAAAVGRLSGLAQLACWWVALGLAYGLWCVAWRYERLVAARIAMFVIWVGVGGAWHQFRSGYLAETDVLRSAPPWRIPVAVRGQIVSAVQHVPPPEPDALRAGVGEPRTRFRLRVRELRRAAEWEPVTGHVEVICRGELPGYVPGDVLQIFGELSRMSAGTNPGEPDSLAWGRLQDCGCWLGVAHPDAVQLWAAEHGWLTELARWRQHANETLSRRLPEDVRGLGAALLLGLRHEMAADETDAFRATGTMHVLALSGMHLSVLAGAVAWLVRGGWLSRRWVAGGVAMGSGVYALLTEANAPILRAAILIQLASGAVVLRRPLDPRHALTLSAVGVLIWDPRQIFQVGPWLSFLAVFALGEAASIGRWSIPSDSLDRLERRFQPRWRTWCRDGVRHLGVALAVSVTVWLATLPLVAQAFHLISPWAPLLNLLLALPTAMALISGFLVILAEALLPVSAPLWGKVCEFSLQAMVGIVEATTTLPQATWWVAGPTWGAVLTWYSIVGWGWLSRTQRRSVRLCSLALATVVMQVWTYAERWEPPGSLQVIVLSVGHGACTIAKLPQGTIVVVDAGLMGDPRWGAERVSRALWEWGVEHIDRLVISHPDADHFNVVPELLNRFRVQEVIVPPRMFAAAAQQPSVACLFEHLQRHGTRCVTVSGGRLLNWERDVELEVLHPPEQWTVAERDKLSARARRRSSAASDNAESLVLSLRYQGRGVLLPGDLESPGLEAVMAQRPDPWDCVIAPHHGSAASDPVAFANWSGARCWIASGNHDDIAGWSQVSAQLPTVQALHTAGWGAIYIVIRAGQLRVQTHRARPPGWPPSTAGSGP